MMEESSDESQQQQWMHVMNREQILNKSQSQSWEEKAFAEDAARIIGGSMWPQRSYSCTFCRRDFKSAQALGGHMNIHRRDRARLKQHNHHHHATTITTTTRLSCLSSTTQDNFSPSFSTILGHMGSPNSEQEGVVKAREEYKFNGLGCRNYVETSFSVGRTSMFGKKTSPCGDIPNNNNISCNKRSALKSRISSSLQPLFLKPCSNDRSLFFQPVDLDHGMEDLDLELRLGKQQKVK